MNINIVEFYLKEFKEKKSLGHRTYNHYVQALDSFCSWLLNSGFILVSPLRGMIRLRTEVDVRHKRHALTSQEVGHLARSARKSGKSIQTFDGETHARIATWHLLALKVLL